jgi:subtilase family serine protease
MCAWGPVIQFLRSGKPAGPSEQLRVAVTFPRREGQHGPTKPGVHLSLKNVMDFVPEAQKMDKGIDALSKLGFTLIGRGRLTASMRCTKETFETTFSTTLKEFNLDIQENYAFHSFYFPAQGAGWKFPPALAKLIDDVYIQWPHIFMAPIPSVRPPKVKYYHLNVPRDVATLLNAAPLHKKGIRGEGIRVVMIDSGFAHESHPYFATHAYSSRVVLAGEAKDEKIDRLGHGTGHSANIFSLVPRAEFVGVKIAADDLNDMFYVNPASLLEGFYTARQQDPDVISISAGSDLREEGSTKQLSNLPNNLKALEAEILHAVASGVVVVAAAGNGQFSFPGMMPDVISAGGVYVDNKRKKRASNKASAYNSKIYPGRHVPDVCGLVGMEQDRYIMLPIPPGCLLDLAKLFDPKSGTTTNDGWAAFSGTSAAAPQIAGVCALLKSKNRSLTPSDVKAILRSTAVKVRVGKSNPKSSDDCKTPQKAGKGVNGATGAGLADALSAWQEVK